MGYSIKSNTVYSDVYETLCDIVQNDDSIKELSVGLVFDFNLATAPPTPAMPRDVPRMYLLPDSVDYPVLSSCANGLTLGFSFVIEGYHFRDIRLQKLAWRLMFLLRNIPFTSLRIDDRQFPVICTVGSGAWEYNPERQTMSHRVGLTVVVAA